MKSIAAFVAVWPMLFTACGYHVAGKADLMPKSIHTIAIKPFHNNTQRNDLARLLPEDIGREMNSRAMSAGRRRARSLR